jgi:hypothetical protein
MRPAQAGLTAASNSRTTLRWLMVGSLKEFLRVLVTTEWLLAARRGAVLPSSAKSNARGGVNCFGTCWERAGTAKKRAVSCAGTNHAATACTGARKTDSIGECEKLAIPMINSCLKEVYIGRISGWQRCQRGPRIRVLVTNDQTPATCCVALASATSAWCCGSNRRPDLRVRKAHRASR